MIVRITCREAHRLLSERLDRPLARGEQIRLRLHLWVCRVCSRVQQQFAVIRGAVRRFDV